MEANRKFIEQVIELSNQGKSVEEIMFSLNMVYEDEDMEVKADLYRKYEDTGENQENFCN